MRELIYRWSYYFKKFVIRFRGQILFIIAWIVSAIASISINSVLFAAKLGQIDNKIYALDFIVNNPVIVVIVSILLLVLGFYDFEVASSLAASVFFAVALFQIFPNKAVFILVLVSGVIWCLLDRDYFVYYTLDRVNPLNFVGFIAHLVKVISYIEIVSCPLMLTFGYDKIVADHVTDMKKNLLIMILLSMIPWLVVGIIVLIQKKVHFPYSRENIVTIRYCTFPVFAHIMVAIRVISLAFVVFIGVQNREIMFESDFVIYMLISVLLLLHSLKVWMMDFRNKKVVVPVDYRYHPEKYFSHVSPNMY